MSLRHLIRDTLHWIRFAGFKYRCPLCNRTTRLFTPSKVTFGQPTIDRYKIIGMGARPHYRCPWCNSSDKERLVWLFLESQTDILETERPLKVLHIAPEKNTQKRLRAHKNIEYIAGDKFEGNERYTPERYGGAVYVDITDMSQFADGTFDVVICNHVLEHVPDDRKGMREIYRVLKPCGFAILQAPVSRRLKVSIEAPTSSPEERIELFGQADHVRVYSEIDYLERLKFDGGFKLNFWNPWPIHPRFGVNKAERVVMAKKLPPSKES